MDFKRIMTKFLFLPNQLEVKVDVKDRIYGGINGFIVGDILGLPVEFTTREELSKNPVKDMMGNMTHNQPVGTWSDDTSLTLALMESLSRGYDIDDIKSEYISWYKQDKWTPNGKIFDMGRQTRIALKRLSTGSTGLYDDEDVSDALGNGALMRVSPLIPYLNRYPKDKFSKIKELSKITHGDITNEIACAIYIEIGINLLNGQSPVRAYENMKPVIMKEYYDYSLELQLFDKILKRNIYQLNKSKIESSGYVVHTLESVIWSLLTSFSYEETVLKAVNLGNDADTIGALAGGLAGYHYGINSIRQDWINKIVKIRGLREVFDRFYNSIR